MTQYLLDTNVVSELRKAGTRRMHPVVAAWAQRTAAQDFYLSVISLLEVRVGALLVSRRDVVQGAILQRWVNDQVLTGFSGRILPVDTLVVERCAALHVPSRKSDRDALLAATALVHDLTVVTRSVADFQDTGAQVLNPWDAPS